MKSLEGASLDTLTAAQTILQRAHDRIEQIGFDIQSYDSGSESPACYIGSVRKVARLHGNPVEVSESRWEGTLEEQMEAQKLEHKRWNRRLNMKPWQEARLLPWDYSQTWAGGGAPLKLALELLDELVYPFLSAERRVVEVEEHYVYTTGRYVEQYGFQSNDTGEDSHPEAIGLFRTALTALYNKIEEIRNVTTKEKEEERESVLV
jgi:hypothetical protein